MTKLLCLIALLLLAGAPQAQTFLVSSRNTHSVKRYDLGGNYLGDFVMPGSGGLSFPQEVVWHPDGFLLVTGRGNTAVLKYDGMTGDFIGHFTSGYSLDNPTKTSIWQDSLLYVSQWGVTQNKVARFDLKTGVFVDEFTSTGVPNGCGHAWDDDGNLLVAQYGNGVNGKVWKFGPDGNYLGDFVSSAQLQGPVNLWFDETGALFVADWTLGSVLKFDGSSGAFAAQPVSGLNNVEGYAFDNSGRLYLCDWTANKVFRFDFSTGALTPFITTGGLAAPNSILIRPEASATTQAKEGRPALNVSPNPASGPLRISCFLEKTSHVRLDVLDVSGRQVAAVFSGKQGPGEHDYIWNASDTEGMRTAPGVYFIRLTTEHAVTTRAFVLQ